MYPSFLYGDSKDDTVYYSEVPPGPLSGERFVRGEPCWKQSGQEPERQKMKLVFSDWTLSGYSRSELEQAKKVLLRMLDDGFELYAWQNDKIIPINKEDVINLLPCSSFRNGLVAPDQQTLLLALSENDVEADKALILDYFQCRELFFKDQKMYLYSHNIMRSEAEIDTIISSLGQKKNSKLVDTEYPSPNTRYSFSTLKICMPGIEDKKKIKYAKVKYQSELYALLRYQTLKDLEELECSRIYGDPGHLLQILSKTPKLKFLGVLLFCCGNYKLDQENYGKIELNQLEELDCSDTSIGINLLIQILSKAPNIKKIRLYRCCIDGELDLTALDPVELSQLKEISLEESKISCDLLAFILSKAPNLKVINLKKCNIDSEGYDPKLFDNIQLKQLEDLNCSSSNIFTDLFAHIVLKNPSKLKRLKFKFCNNLDKKLENFFLKTKTGTQLHYFECNYSCISDSLYCNLLLVFPKLWSIDLKEVKITSSVNLDQDVCEKIELNELISVFCIYSSINTILLSAIVSNSPNIKGIALIDCRSIGLLFSDKAYEKMKLHYLEKMDLTHSSINTRLLEQLLSKAPNIKEINLSRCEEIHEFSHDALDHIELRHLVRLNCSGSSINTKLLSQFLMKAPNLEEIDLSVCKNIVEFRKKDFDRIELIYLKKINLHRSLINIPSLGILLLRSPNISEINLYYCHNIVGEFTQENYNQIQLERLEKLVCVDCSFSAVFLIQIISKAPHLKKLDLRGYNKINGNSEIDLFERVQLERLEELDFGNSKITATLLIHILSKVPNLKKLNLSGSHFSGEVSWDILDQIELSQLEELDYCNTDVASCILVLILSKAPNLRVVDLRKSRYRNIHLSAFQDFSVEKIQLPRLEILNCNESGIPANLLVHIVTRAPNLKKIKIKDCCSLQGEFDTCISFQSINNQLKELDFSRSSLTASLIFQFLILFPEVRSIDLIECTIKSDHFHQEVFELIKLDNLNEITLRQSDINTATLAQFLLKAPNVNGISLTDCQGIIGEFNPEVFDRLKLSQLEYFFCNHSSVSDNLLRQIKAKAPNIKILDSSSRTSSTKNSSKSSHISSHSNNAIASTTYGSSINPKNGGSRHFDQMPLDADTGPSKSRNEVSRVFIGRDGHHPSVRDYRQRVYRYLRVEDNFAVNPFTWFNKDPLDLTRCENVISWLDDEKTIQKAWEGAKSQSNQYYYGILDVPPSSEWQSLPSVAADETITHICTDRSSINIQYSKRDNLYYLKNTSRASLKLYYIVEVPHQLLGNFDSGIQELIEQCSHFKAATLKLKNSPTGWDYINAMFEQQAGACRHRAGVFVAKMQKEFPHIPVRGVCNDCHTFVEIFYQGRWVSCDLGGIPAELDISDKNHPNLPHRQVQITNSGSAKSTIEEYFHEHILSYGKNSLVEVHSTEELRSLVSWVKMRYPNTFFVEDAQELEPVCDEVNKQKSRQILLVNFGNFEEEEMAGFISEKTRKSLPRDTCIVGLYILEGSFAEKTEQFLAYFHNKLELLPFDPCALSPFIPKDTPEPEKANPKTTPEPEKALPAKKVVQQDPEVRRRATKKMLDRKIFETICRVFDNKVEKFTLQWDHDNAPTNFSDFVQRHVLKPGENVHIGVHSPEELDHCILWLHKEIPTLYHLDSPKDIRCSSRWISPDGAIRPGPGGPLFEYLRSAPNPVLIVNFNTFEPGDLVRCNTVYDSKNREADGISIPKNACVIGLSVIHPGSYQGSDFTGRFPNKVELTPFPVPEITFATALPSPAKKVDLYGVDTWKEILEGRWTVKNNRFSRKLGKIEKGYRNFEIQNGPWEERDFRFFMQRACLKWGLSLMRTTTHNLEQFAGLASWTDVWLAGVKPAVINPTFLGCMEENYRLDDGMITSLPGTIETAPHKTLYAYLTRGLNDKQWYRLLKLCKKYQVRLSLMAPEGVDSPIMQNGAPAKIFPSAEILVTETMDDTIKHLEQKYPKAKVLDISDCDSRILYSMDPTWIGDTEFRLRKYDGALYQLLQSKEHVILKGKFSKRLIDALMPLILPPGIADEALVHEGRLTLVPDSSEGFELFYIQSALLSEAPPSPATFTLPEIAVGNNLHPFEKDRLEQVIQAFNQDPHAHIEGETGVGKTTFVKEILAKHPAFKVYFGMENFKAWATSTTKKIPVLFVDEMNAQKIQFSLFEGLYHSNKGIVYEGNYYPLNSRHRLISAGNPLSYGGERRQVEFLKRHQNKIIFTPLPDDYLYEKLQEAFALPSETLKLFLEVYKQAKILSPRELEMMALLVLAGRDPKLAAYRITRHALPENDRKEFSTWFEKRFGKVEEKVSKTRIHDFELTPSREEAYGIVSDFLAVRKLRIETGAAGGLGAVIFEGAPGDGKSHFIEACLLEAGFVKVEPYEIGTTKKNAFCRLPANMPADEKIECLLAAFEAGQIVICDEINSCERLEGVLNDLLMGFNIQKKAAKKPGFALFGSQNPIYLKGRKATTKASKRRVVTCEFSPYPRKEVFQIVHRLYPEISQEAIRVLTRNPMSFRECLSLVEKGLQAPRKRLDPLPDSLEQIGPTCKLYTLSAVMTWIYNKTLNGHPPPPARKQDTNAESSLRSVAKQKGFSQVGEIYNPEHLVEMAKEYGFSSTQVIESSGEEYIKTLVDCIDRGTAPILFFDVELGTGRPIQLESENEHAAVCVGYFYDLEKELYFTLLHWGKPWAVKAQDLAASAGQLSLDREPETFYKVDHAWRKQGDRLDTQKDLQRLLRSKKFVKREGTKTSGTFRNKVIVVA